MTRPARRRCDGFTLIELLVVIGIIALLIGILLPSLNRARVMARQAVCLSNVRQLALATCVYSAEWRGVICPTAIAGGTDTLNGVTGKAVYLWSWQYIVDPMNPLNTQYSFGNGLLGRYLKSEKVLQCPELQSLGIPVERPGMPLLDYGVASTMGATPYLSSIRNTSETVLFGDAIMYNSEKPNGFVVARTSSISAPSTGAIALGAENFHGRHVNGNGCLSFYDGHAEAVLAQTRPANLYSPGLNPTAIAVLKKLHIGSAMSPKFADFSAATDNPTYTALCKSTLNYYFWADKKGGY